MIFSKSHFLFLQNDYENKLSAPFEAIKKAETYASAFLCREEGIRTLDTVTHILAFQASSFNHSDTSLNYFANKV